MYRGQCDTENRAGKRKKLPRVSSAGYVHESAAVGTKVMVQPQSLDVIRLRIDDPDWVSLSLRDWARSREAGGFRLDRTEGGRRRKCFGGEGKQRRFSVFHY